MFTLSKAFKASLAILTVIGITFGVLPNLKAAIAAVTKQSTSVNYNTPYYQELSAKRWLLKYDPQPSGAFGMPSYDSRTKQKIAQDALKFKQTAQKFVKDNHEFVNFLYFSDKDTDEKAYQTKQAMDLIKLKKTDTGFTYHFQSSGGCFLKEYTGTLIMNGNVITDETMEMHTRSRPC